jgi:hypothetical protein
MNHTQFAIPFDSENISDFLEHTITHLKFIPNTDGNQLIVVSTGYNNSTASKIEKWKLVTQNVQISKIFNTNKLIQKKVTSNLQKRLHSKEMDIRKIN